MRVISTETVVVKPELIRLVRRGDSKKWQAHYKLDALKTWFRRSTNTADVKEATRIAERLWMKATFDQEDGRPVISRRFKPVAEVVLRRLDAEILAATAKPSARDYVSAIRLYLIPFYGNYNIDGIKPAVISEFHVWRRERVGRELSGSAQNTGADSDRRAEFSHEELEAMMLHAPKFIADGRTARTKMIRELLAIYVPFMAATGMRAGTEAEFLEWRHIDVEVRDGQPVLHFRLQRGKLGARNFVAHNSCWLLLERLRQLSPDLVSMTLDEVLKKRLPHRLFRLSDGSVPDNWNKPFRQWLEGASLLNCPVTGKERSLYSLRHYYATQRLLEGIPIHDLSQQMGTSVLMITKHYSHLTSLMKAKQFAGVVDANATGEAAQIRGIMAAQMANNNILSLVQMGTGLTMRLVLQSPSLTGDFENRLKSHRARPT